MLGFEAKNKDTTAKRNMTGRGREDNQGLSDGILYTVEDFVASESCPINEACVLLRRKYSCKSHA